VKTTIFPGQLTQKRAWVSPAPDGISSRHDLFDHMPMHIRQPALDAVVVVAELFVIEAG
jgi:hypothetical protein